MDASRKLILFSAIVAGLAYLSPAFSREADRVSPAWLVATQGDHDQRYKDGSKGDGEEHRRHEECNKRDDDNRDHEKGRDAARHGDDGDCRCDDPGIPTHEERIGPHRKVRIVKSRSRGLTEDLRRQVPVSPCRAVAADDLRRAGCGYSHAISLQQPDEAIDAGYVLDNLVAAESYGVSPAALRDVIPGAKWPVRR